MLKYQSINCFLDAKHRIERNDNRWTRDANYDSSSDLLTVWTLQSQVEKETKENFDFMLKCGRDHGAEYIVVKHNLIQYVGSKLNPAQLENAVTPQQFKDEQQAYLVSRDENRFSRYYNFGWDTDDSGQGHSMSLRFYSLQYVDPDQTRGVYDVATGERLTNRHTIIEEFWRMGFGARRGRPLQVAQIKWSGNRQDLEELTETATKYWARRNSSDVARKITAAYRSINRYVAWPGNW